MSELQSWIDALGRLGATGAGGVFRGSYTTAEREAHDLVSGWMREAGLRTWRDAVGNLWGRVDGTLAGALAVVTGSHLDSVRNGGNYDGPFGVLGGLLAVRDLVGRHGPPKVSVEVVAFTGEEASRFPLGLMGSRGVAGTLDRRLLDHVRDDAGLTVAEGMRQVGLDPDRIPEARRRDIAAFVEMHIEQGPVLETASVPIGIVQSIVGIQQVRVTVRGRADHAGTTPMGLRRDALLGAARMIACFPDVAARAEGGVMTVGRIAALPGSSNVVPETVEFTIDVRHQVEAVKRQMVDGARAMCEEVAVAAALGLDWKPALPGSEAAPLSDRIRALLRRSCEAEGLRYLEMPSGAGHDARSMAALCPTGMLFIPCKNGRSHTPEEFALATDMDTGVAVLSRCLYRLAWEGALGAAA